MTVRAPNSEQAAANDVRQAFLRRLVLGGGLAAALALYGYELASRNPNQTFALLQQFGPWFVLAVIVAIGGWDLARQGIAHLGKLSESVHESAMAMQEIADKDDRRAEEIQIVAQFNARSSEKILTLMGEHSRKLEQICERLEHMGK